MGDTRVDNKEEEKNGYGTYMRIRRASAFAAAAAAYASAAASSSAEYRWWVI